jgi:acetyl esterase/lipase
MLVKTIELYDNRANVTLTTYVLDDSPEMLNGRKRPAILICPGGAYLGCSDREAEPIALRFASMGYHAFVLRYSTYLNRFLDDIDPAVPVNPDSVHPAPMRDIGKAMLIIRENADDWLLDTDKIILCGFSAGGHNCAMYSVYWDKPILTDHFGVDASQLKPAASILGYAVTDYRIRWDDVDSDSIEAKAPSIAFFGTPTPSDDALEEASPVLHVSQATPPTFLWATSSDTVVVPQHTLNMAHALAEAGVPFAVHIFEDGVHGLSLADQATAGARAQIEQDAAKWIPLVEAWLKKRFALSIPE